MAHTKLTPPASSAVDSMSRELNGRDSRRQTCSSDCSMFVTECPTGGAVIQLQPPSGEPIFARHGTVIVFNQLGLKLELDADFPQEKYFGWRDGIAGRIDALVPGSQIVEKTYARTAPRRNTGVYYDTPDRDLVARGAVL